MIPVRQSATGVAFEIKVHPRARKNAITGILGGALKLALAAPPVQGRANQAVIEFFAEFFEIPRSSVTIASGTASRKKRVHILGITPATAQQRLEKAVDNL
jgi:uncharacterized protein